MKRALRGGAIGAARSALYPTSSRPSDATSAGRIGVKVIHHYGGEVLGVCTPADEGR